MDIRIPNININGVQLYQILKIMDSSIKVPFVSALDAADELMSIFPGIKSGYYKKAHIEGHFVEKVNEGGSEFRTQEAIQFSGIIS
jgi:hypothetical protein